MNPSLESRWAERIVGMIDSGEVTLPVLPDLVLKLQRELASDGTDARRIADWVRADAGVTAMLLRSANSALYGGVQPITDVGQAIARLGLRSVHSLVMTVTLKGQFSTEDPRLLTMLRTLWDQSITCAAAARVLSARIGRDAEEGFLAGLLHGIGRLVVLRALDTIAQRGDSELPEGDELPDLIEQLQAPLGVQMLQSWNMPAAVVACAEAFAPGVDPGGEGENPLLDTILAADCLARKLGFHVRPDPQLDLVEHPAIQRLGFSDLEVASLAVDLEDVVGALRGML